MTSLYAAHPVAPIFLCSSVKICIFRRDLSIAPNPIAGEQPSIPRPRYSVFDQQLIYYLRPRARYTLPVGKGSVSIHNDEGPSWQGRAFSEQGVELRDVVRRGNQHPFRTGNSYPALERAVTLTVFNSLTGGPASAGPFVFLVITSSPAL
jgi:hypothetical protein